MLEEGAWILLFGKNLYITIFKKDIIVIFVIGGRNERGEVRDTWESLV
jgi:hypothetical protein